MASSASIQWLHDLGTEAPCPAPIGLVPVSEYRQRALSPEQLSTLERAGAYGAHAVFFAAEADGRRSPIACIFLDDGITDQAFAETHRRLWSWGRVPLVYRKVGHRVDLLRCAHGPDFRAKDGRLVYRAFSTLDLLTALDDAVTAQEPWWDASQLQTGTLWDRPAVTRRLLDARRAAHPALIAAITQLQRRVVSTAALPPALGRRLLVLSLLIAYLEDRGVLRPSDFGAMAGGTHHFFETFRDGDRLLALFDRLARRFNGDVFSLADGERAQLLSADLGPFADLIEGRSIGGQLTFWRLYSFRDLPIEMISHIYDLFVTEKGSVYTPPFLVHLLLDETLDWDRVDRILDRGEVILDPACGSGVFLVEAYRRLILRWRHRNGWQAPTPDVLRGLLGHIQGIDTNGEAIELAAFSLCLALCDALDADVIRRAAKLFPRLESTSLFTSCFFAWQISRAAERPVGVVIGNPPFVSDLTTEGAVEAARIYEEAAGAALPDRQMSYLFLHAGLELLSPGGLLCMLQPYGLLYNANAESVRRALFDRWNVREILDFVCIRGLFGAADTKVVCVVAESGDPTTEPLTHATFRRTERIAAQHGFDIDLDDLHRLPRTEALADHVTWRCNLVGGARTRALIDRLRRMRPLAKCVERPGWHFGEGYIKGSGGHRVDYLSGKTLLPSTAIGPRGIDWNALEVVEWDGTFEGPRTRAQFTTPLLVIREHMNLDNDHVPSGVTIDDILAYKDQVVGIAVPSGQAEELVRIKSWLDGNRAALQAWVAATSDRLFTKRSTSVSKQDISRLPMPESGDLALSDNERLLVEDIVEHYRDLVRLGQKSRALAPPDRDDLEGYGVTWARQIGTVYGGVRPLEPFRWPGFICQPFAFGDVTIDWSGVDQLRDRIRRLLDEAAHPSLRVRRIARIYDGRLVFFLKPDVRRYWLRSTALRDADETIMDLHHQGY